MIRVFEQYYFQKGHYGRYFDTLVSTGGPTLGAAWDFRPHPMPGVKTLRPFGLESGRGILEKTFSRLVNSISLMLELLRSVDYRSDVVHLIDFEPFTFLLFGIATRFWKGWRFVITVHAVDKAQAAGGLAAALISIRHSFFLAALRLALHRGAVLVTHYQCHADRLRSVAGDPAPGRITVVPYPCPEAPPLPRKAPPTAGPRRLLLYGQLRQDKGIPECLERLNLEGCSLTVAGRVLDGRLSGLEGGGARVLDRFIEEEELAHLFAEADFAFLPYGPRYTGGAGPLKDAMAHGKPVVCSDLPIFREIVGAHGVGVIVDGSQSVAAAVEKVSGPEYAEMVERCISYARTWTWRRLGEEYGRIYREREGGGR
jgi:glycosyltransferase involved in cell wall biosynthesis